MEIAVLGAGAFGTALAKMFSAVDGRPHDVTLWCRSDETAQRIATTRQSTHLPRVTLGTSVPVTHDPAAVVGVALGGALKNVFAIGAGIADGMGFGHNSRAAMITRGLNEMARLGLRRGANPLTFAGLAGMGDLVLTCTGDLSRNRQVGLEL